MKRTAAPILALLALVLASGASCQPDDPVTLTILHTNDMHAS
jgi:2',3'-cyclic-nucleotide 2'-phosphodiesterase (5'-nucleotidase family)